MLYTPRKSHSSIYKFTNFTQQTAKQEANRAKIKAANYLSAQLKHISDPFQMAITAYALQVAGHKDSDTAYKLMNELQTKGLLGWVIECLLELYTRYLKV